MFKGILALAALGATLAAVTPSSAAVVAGPTVGGYATFTDTLTGKNWLNLGTFFNKSSADMIAAVTPAGFTFADRSDVETLLNSLPLDDGQWTGYRAIMGGAPNRDLIWASYGPADDNGLYGYAFAYGFDVEWFIFDGINIPSAIENGDSPEADMNIWAYVGGTVPEPASWTMMIAGFGMAGTALRRRRLAIV